MADNAKTIGQKLINLGYVNKKFLGKGYYGRVFDLGNGKVLKMTKDKKEAILTSLLIGKKSKYIVNVFRVFVFKTYDLMWFIEEEKLQPIKQSIENEIEDSGLADAFNNYFEGFNQHDYNQIIFIDNQLNNAPENKEIKKFIRNMLGAAIELKRNKVDFRDFHVGNIMYDPKKEVYKIIDLGITSTKNDKNNLEILD